MEKEKTETIEISEATADHIRKQDLFKLYSSLEDFVLDAIRERLMYFRFKGLMK